jgi:stage II sporulation protein P
MVNKVRRFKTRKTIPFSLLKLLLFIILLLISFIYTIKILFKLYVSQNNEAKVNEMLSVSTNNIIGNISFLDLINFNLTKHESLLKVSLNNINTLKIEPKVTTKTIKNNNPIVYIYNTHQSEEYAKGTLASYNITPTVFMASHILRKTLINYQINALVEEENIKEVLNKNNWNYNDSYNASMLWLNNAFKNYPTLKYFIDVHRDSASGTVTINDKVYAKMMFVIGMAHPNYKQNESLALRINDYINNKYNGIMRSPFYGKRSEYNQNFNPNTILIEVGGPDNTIEEVYNSTLILGEAISNIIGEDNGK